MVRCKGQVENRLTFSSFSVHFENIGILDGGQNYYCKLISVTLMY